MHRSSGERSNRVLLCHLTDNINTIFCVIIRFDPFWYILGIIGNGEAWVKGAENNIFYFTFKQSILLFFCIFCDFTIVGCNFPPFLEVRLQQQHDDLVGDAFIPTTSLVSVSVRRPFTTYVHFLSTASQYFCLCVSGFDALNCVNERQHTVSWEAFYSFLYNPT